MKKEEFVDEVLTVYEWIIEREKVVPLRLSKNSAMQLAIEAVKQDIEYKNSLPVVSRGIERVGRNGRN